MTKNGQKYQKWIKIDPFWSNFGPNSTQTFSITIIYGKTRILFFVIRINDSSLMIHNCSGPVLGHQVWKINSCVGLTHRILGFKKLWNGVEITTFQIGMSLFILRFGSNRLKSKIRSPKDGTSHRFLSQDSEEAYLRHHSFEREFFEMKKSWI